MDIFQKINEYEQAEEKAAKKYFGKDIKEFFNKIRDVRKFCPNKIHRDSTLFNLQKFLLIFPLTKKEKTILFKLSDEAKFGFHSRRLIKIAYSLNIDKEIIEEFKNSKNSFKINKKLLINNASYFETTVDRIKNMELSNERFSEVRKMAERALMRTNISEGNVKEAHLNLQRQTNVLLKVCINRKLKAGVH